MLVTADPLGATWSNSTMDCKSASARDVCTRILSKIEQNPDITLQQLAEEYRQLVNPKHNSDMVQQSVPATTSTINTIQRQQSPKVTQNKPPSACWNFARKCPFKTYRGHECNRQGHKDGFYTPLGVKQPTSDHETKTDVKHGKERCYQANSKSNRKYVCETEQPS